MKGGVRMQSLPMAAFTAGLISFLSPCVLPLVPGYVSLISGTGVEELKQRNGKLLRSVLLNSVLFILGFTAVFLVLGAVATAVAQLVRQNIAFLSKIAGAVIVLLGLHQTGLLPLRFLYADKRFHGAPAGAAGFRAFLIGSAFGFGWTPCVGPVLAVILALAAREATVGKGVSLLAVYALGLALPFLLTAFSIEGFLTFYARFKTHLRKLEIGSGLVMIAVGVLIFTRHLVLLNHWLSKVSLLGWMTERFQ
jgi:cytochrome c-type biogenesis protein